MLNLAIKSWYKTVVVLIFLIIVVGGITRLTGSGLSMVDWRPVMGILPPLSTVEWQGLFDQYKLFPQYKLENSSMTLAAFKAIFFWEYLHRILGRLIGLSLILPFVYFLLKKQLSKPLIQQSIVMIVLVIAQGLMGWYMVKSGLVDNPAVSHFRLAAHLSLALLLLAYLYRTIFFMRAKRLRKGYVLIKSWLAVSFVLLCVQIVYGAFTAGLKAGYYYNTYPKMGGQWLPDSAFMYSGFLSNLVQNPIMIQYVHRHLALFVSLSVLISFILILNSDLSGCIKNWALMLFGFVLCQFCLGVLTLVLKVPISLAVGHQFVAVLLFSVLIYLRYQVQYERVDKNEKT